MLFVKNLRDRIFRKDTEIERLKAEVKQLKNERTELRQSLFQMDEDIREVKQQRDSYMEAMTKALHRATELEEALEESERDVRRINSEYADARSDIRMILDRMFMTLTACDSDTEARSLIDTVKLYVAEHEKVQG
jgi:chromosome segregation ATPase